MKEDQKHIRQKLTDQYPEPDLPAESAWTGMKDMLDLKFPVNQSLISKLTSFKTLLFAAPVGLVSIGAVLWILTQHKSATIPSSKNSTILVERKTSGQQESKQSVERLEIKENIDSSRKLILDSDTTSIETTSNSPQPKATDLASATLSAKKVAYDYSKASRNVENDLKTENVFAKSTPILSKNPERKPRTGFSSGDNRALHSRAKRHMDNPVVSSVKGIFTKERLTKKTDQNWQTENFSRTSEIARTAVNHDYKSSTSDSGRNATQTAQPAGRSDLVLSFELLHSKSAAHENLLKQKLSFIPIQPSTVHFTRKRHHLSVKGIFQDIHFGLQWNAGLPAKGYDMYFKGTNEKNQPYNLLIPGIWVKKQLSDKNEIQVRVSPYSQYFGGDKEIAGSSTKLTDSTNYQSRLGLVKISGFNAGLQFNRQIYKNWQAGFGANLQWQQRGLISRSISTSDTSRVVDYDALFSIKQTSNEGKYLNLYFVTANAEIFYSWRQFQLGGGIVVPVTSMTTSTADRQLKPVSGQLFLRWQLE